MSETFQPGQCVLSGMRATGALHLGHYHGVIQNWLSLQNEHTCYFFVADWHALTTHYEELPDLERICWDMIIDWLACGVNPKSACLFIQSHVPAHAELHLLLSMITPLSWLERVPSYKDQIQKLSERDLDTYGFLGYPLLQAADILLYHADLVPVGEDQLAHVELAREVARRFNHLYGRDPNYMVLAEQAIKKLGQKNAQLYRKLLRAYQEQGDADALQTGQALVEAQRHLSVSDQERLLGYLEGGGKMILTEPQASQTTHTRLTGIDGQKMSKSYRNTIALRDSAEVVSQKLLKMPTDPARVRREDPGEPEKCPVWDLHQVYSGEEVKEWVVGGCRTAGIGCVQCKRALIDGVEATLSPIRERAVELSQNPDVIRGILAEGTEKASEVAERTLKEVRSAIGLPKGRGFRE